MTKKKIRVATQRKYDKVCQLLRHGPGIGEGREHPDSIDYYMGTLQVTFILERGRPVKVWKKEFIDNYTEIMNICNADFDKERSDGWDDLDLLFVTLTLK